MTPTATRNQGRVDALLARMTLREKIGQMTQPEKNSATPDDVRAHALGSVISGGGGNPEPNTPEAWRAMVLGFREAARESRLGIPLLYGVDAVHGHNNVVGATVFPHNVGLGAIGDPDLVRRVARATAREVAATGVRWTFAPAVSIPVDVRWGRTYEGYGQDPELVGRLAAAYVEGLRGVDWASPDALLPSVKHFLADGAARHGTSTRWDRAAVKSLSDDPTLANAHLAADFLEVLDRGAWTIDQGDVDVDERTMREVFLAPYRAALAAGALNVMASYGSWHGLRMHEHRHLLTDVLKGELSFEGFVVSDWAAIDQLDPDYEACVERSVNAGIDMVMVPFDWRRFMDALEAAVERGAVPLARIDDAVRRILVAKERLGLFDGADEPELEPPLDVVGHPDHRRIAHEAARRSPVLLKNRGEALPLPPTLPALLVAGAAADDVGLQCGGWTVSWMGAAGPITPGTTLLQGLRRWLPDTELMVEPDGRGSARAPAGLVVVAEEPYAEGMGDRHDLDLPAVDVSLIERVRARVDTLVLVVYSGRPVVLGAAAQLADAIVAAWLPGSEGAAVAEPLVGASGFEATLRTRWPIRSADLPLHPFGAEPHAGARPLFEIGQGLRTAPWSDATTPA
ncbi:MAG: glycoside hydrolase family 3 N-terminal domain-containing protein [Trueperaceae bacterium]|nr:glycoside hydrolase family 3 N-terminal domain-containing protein [Trueperaceae bacterium]